MGALRGRQILVTGGAGFLGRHVCDALEPYAPAGVFVPRSAEYDLRRRESIARLFRVAQPQVVIHLAAVVGGIGANQRHPGKFFYDNAIMGIELMEQARLFGVEKFISTGSICAYPKHTPVPFREEELWNGYPEETNAPYGLAKKMLLVQAQAYRQEYAFPAITLFPVNLYGPGDNFDLESSHVIPALIRKMLSAREEGQDEVEVWGTGSASREFLYVKDAARGIAAAADLYDKPDPVNLGSGQEITIRRLSEMIADLCGYHGQLRWNSSKPDGQPRRCLDTTRARREFNFQAATNLQTGLRETIQWYESQPQHELVGHAA